MSREIPENADDLYSDPLDKKPLPEFLDERRSNSNLKIVRQKETRQVQGELKEEGDLIEVLSSDAGVRFLVRVLIACGIDQPVFHPSNSWMCEVAGRRQIGNQLRDWIKDCGLEHWMRVEQEFEQHRPKRKSAERSEHQAKR